jgi:hypothetical protein
MCPEGGSTFHRWVQFGAKEISGHCAQVSSKIQDLALQAGVAHTLFPSRKGEEKQSYLNVKAVDIVQNGLETENG